MQNRILATLALTIATVYPSLGMDETKSIFVEYNPTQAKVEILSNKNLQISPIDTYTKPLSITASEDYGANYITIRGLEAALETQQFYTTPFTGDITNLEAIDKNHTYHYIRNAGFIHAANSHFYDECTLGLEANGCLHLGPKSEYSPQVNQQLQQALQQQNPNNILGSLIQAFKSDHLGQGNAQTVHKGKVQQDCAIANIIVRSYLGMQRSVPISGSIEYGVKFAMNFSTQNTVLEIVPNQSFKFDL
jgi:hypothetical protein